MVEASEKAYLGELAKWIMAYVDVRTAYFNKPFVYIDNENMYTPLVINDGWIKNELEGYKTVIYSDKELTNDDILRTIKRFIHLLPTVKTIQTNSEKEHLRELILVELPVAVNNDVNTVLLDIFLNVNSKSCMRYNKMYSMHGFKDDEFFEYFRFCLITNPNKTKLYGRTWYNEEQEILLNTYQSEVKHALTNQYAVHEINNNINRHFYLNEIIFLGKTIKLDKIKGLDIAVLRRCDNCGELVHEDNMVYLENGDCYCEDCAREYVGWCSYCEYEYDIRHTHIYRLRNDEYICEHCLAERRIDV